MTVVKFPDEYQRIVLEKLDRDPKFNFYLAILENYICKDIDVEPLIRWWNTHKQLINGVDAELDFLNFVKKIQLGDHSWNDEKILRLQRKKKTLILRIQKMTYIVQLRIISSLMMMKCALNTNGP